MNYNNIKEDVRIFHFTNIIPFVLFSHKKVNYETLANTLKSKAWMLLLLKKNLNKHYEEAELIQKQM